ncbi:MAG TPA: tRNA epoxyqueuosine(34) reductase QueG [Clostridia bacterium]|nr:tRNA epoxyqueuosine(34) reductase QueG [Clostridia bacterium]
MDCISKKEIKKFAQQIGIDLVGFASPDCLKNYKNFLEERKNLGYSCSIEERDIQKRISPEFILPEVKSIIAIALSYNVEYEVKYYSRSFGIVSRSSWGIDYHKVLKEKMEKLCEFIRSRCQGVKTAFLVDNNPLLERTIAYHAGIGWFGKNGLIINDEYGSYIFLGEILINKYFAPDTPQKSKCGDCELCIKACPTKAIVKPYIVNANRCLSYVTVKKGEIEEDLLRKLGRKIYGCDTCQEVCPFNKKAKKVKRQEFTPDKLLPRHDLIEILNMTNKDFKEIFGPTSSSWRGKSIIIRNAIIACVNIGEKTCVEPIKNLLKSQSPIIRGYSAWALSYLCDKEKIAEEIKELLVKERDEFAKEMMIKAINRLKG